MSTSNEIEEGGVRVAVNINAPAGAVVDVQINVDGCCGCGAVAAAPDRRAELEERWLELAIRGADDQSRGLAEPPEVLQGGSAITDLPNNAIGSVVASVDQNGHWTEDWFLDTDVLATFSLGQSFRLKYESANEDLPENPEGHWAQLDYYYLPIPRANDLRRWPAANPGTVSRVFEIADDDGTKIGSMLREQDPSGTWFEHWVLKPEYAPPGPGGNVVTLNGQGVVTQSAAEFITEETQGEGDLSAWFYIGVAFTWQAVR